MAMEISIERGQHEVQAAILQFAARRSYRLFSAWWVDKSPHRIEVPIFTEEERERHWNAPLLRRFILGLRRAFDIDQPVRIDVHVKNKRGKSIVKLTVGSNPESAQLAYALRVYLQDERAYSCECPTLCPECSSKVVNMAARYCGRCGIPLFAAARRPPALQEIDVPASEPNIVAIERSPARAEAVMPERAPPEHVATSSAAVVEAEVRAERIKAEASAAESNQAPKAAVEAEPEPEPGPEDEPKVTAPEANPAIEDVRGAAEAMTEEDDSIASEAPARRVLAED